MTYEFFFLLLYLIMHYCNDKTALKKMNSKRMALSRPSSLVHEALCEYLQNPSQSNSS